jgi:hypothetical protein
LERFAHKARGFTVVAEAAVVDDASLVATANPNLGRSR